MLRPSKQVLRLGSNSFYPPNCLSFHIPSPYPGLAYYIQRPLALSKERAQYLEGERDNLQRTVL